MHLPIAGADRPEDRDWIGTVRDYQGSPTVQDSPKCSRICLRLEEGLSGDLVIKQCEFLQLRQAQEQWSVI